MNRPIESDYTSQVAYTRALEAYCNSLTQPAQQEPAPGYCKHCKQYTIEEPLPAQRTWVGLTDEERDAIFELHHTKLGGWDYSGDEVMYDGHFEDAVAAIEAKLKEKNT